MSNAIELVPDPGLMESMRAVGYTLETAIADLIDNSITAGARNVQVRFNGEIKPYVAIVDDGCGMTANSARNAMRLAGAVGSSARASTDLGRFGLGLKTASISQCRRLTVISKKEGELCGYIWDLDYLVETGTWSLIQMSSDECHAATAFSELDKHESGTLVVWDNLDQLEIASGDMGAGLDRRMAAVSRHLGLVFHRFLAGEHGSQFDIQVNNRPIVGADPLLESHKGTQWGPSETIEVDGRSITLRPFTLPHLKRLSTADREKAQIAGTLRDSQGFYVYRALRLVIWGTWFRVAPKQELGKLARVRVDIPNTLDHLWALDIKKAQALPPPIIQTRLRKVAENMIAPSRKAHEYRGRKVGSQSVTHLWDVVADRDSFRYEINRAHPAITALSSDSSHDLSRTIGELLVMLERSFPIDDVYNRLGQDGVFTPEPLPAESIRLLARSIWESLGGALPPGAFVEAMLKSEPFDTYPNSESILKSVTNES